MAVLLRFSVDDLEHLSRAVRAVDVEQPTMVSAAAAVTGLLHRELTDDSGRPACVMVRLYVTQPFRALPENRQELALSLAPDVSAGVSCLVTLATNGDGTLPDDSLPEEHVLPFTPMVFERIPLMTRLLEGVGIDMEAAVAQERAVELRLQHRTFKRTSSRISPTTRNCCPTRSIARWFAPAASTACWRLPGCSLRAG